MSEVSKHPTSEPQELESRFAIPIRYGLMAGFIAMFLTTVGFLYVLKASYFGFLGVTLLLPFVSSIIIYILAGIKQRTAMGGYINIKDAFQAIFVVILISTIISSVYGVIYAKFIDPECMERMKEATLAFFEKAKMPQASIDEQMKKIDDQVNGSLSPGKLLYSFASSVVLQSIVGLICALIIKKERPAQQF